MILPLKNKDKNKGKICCEANAVRPNYGLISFQRTIQN